MMRNKLMNLTRNSLIGFFNGSKYVQPWIPFQQTAALHSRVSSNEICNPIHINQVRRYSVKPTKNDVKKFTFQKIEQLQILIKKIRASETYQDSKNIVILSYYWLRDKFTENVLNNSKVRKYRKDLHDKFEDARKNGPHKR